jgi:hypothetical protein
MEAFFKEYCDHFGYNYDNMIDKYNKMETYDDQFSRYVFDVIINFKKPLGRDLYKQDMSSLYKMYVSKLSYIGTDSEYMLFIDNVDKILSEHDIHRPPSLSETVFNFKDDVKLYAKFVVYYLGTFLENEPTDIKIALKD